MPRGKPKPSGACERTGCYQLAEATVRIWHGKGFGFWTDTIELCAVHADQYDTPVKYVANGASITWHSS